MRSRGSDQEEMNPEKPNTAKGMERPADPPRNGASRESSESMRSFGALGSVGLSFVIAIVLGVAGGLLFDRWVGSGHWGFFIGFFLGLAAGVVNVVRASKSIK